MRIRTANGRGATLEGDLLSVEEVAGFLGVGEVTVWRWCRDGSLPCLKVGRRWRVRRGVLEEYLRNNERSTTLTGRLRSFVEVPDNLLAIAQNSELMLKLDAAFIRVGEARGARLVKIQRQQEDLPTNGELREELKRSGMEVSRLEEEGRLRLLDEEQIGERVAAARRLAQGEGGENAPVWIAFNWDVSMDLEGALRQQRLLSELVRGTTMVVKTTVLEDQLDEWPGSLQRRAQVLHSGTIWLSESGLAMSRTVPSQGL